MMLGIDTDVLVHWAMRGSAHHEAARRVIANEVREGGRLAIALQVVAEFLHVVTDPRRFERPLEMPDAISLMLTFLAGREVVTITPDGDTAERVCALMASLRLGRKRILDTALAATLEAAGVRRLATFNASDFASLGFLEVVDPDAVKPDEA